MKPLCTTPRPRQRGMGLIDAMIAMGILAFGMLALTRLQNRLAATATEANVRLAATQFSDELMASAIVDPANIGCYTLPPAGPPCANATARGLTDGWATRVAQALPAAVVTSVYAAPPVRQLTITMTWTGKDTNQTRTLQSVTNVR